MWKTRDVISPTRKTHAVTSEERQDDPWLTDSERNITCVTPTLPAGMSAYVPL